MKFTRREFLKTSAVVAGFAALSDFTLGGPVSIFVKSAVGSGSSSTDTERLVPSACLVGKHDCGIRVRVVNDRVVRIEGHPDHPRNLGRLCLKGNSGMMWLYDPYRIKAPLKRTNAKGQEGEWVEISWDEALNTLANKINELKANDNKKMWFQYGRHRIGKDIQKAFYKAAGFGTAVGHSSICSTGVKISTAFTFGHASNHVPDYEYTNYVLCFGANLNDAGGPLCFITWQRMLAEQREKRGVRVVQVDPREKPASTFADEWIPIKPQTDAAFVLAMLNVILNEEGKYDDEFLKTYTNAPFLVKSDGTFLKVSDKEQVWDTTTSSAQPYDASGVTPALEGEYTVSGESVKPAFQLLLDHVAQYTPEWAESITGVAAGTIRRIAKEFLDNVRIGSKIVIDGTEMPFRPASIYTYRAPALTELGTVFNRAFLILLMVTGNADVPGGTLFWGKTAKQSEIDKYANLVPKDTPDKLDLKGSVYYPFAQKGITQQSPLTILNPQKYNVDTTPELALIAVMANPLMSYPQQDKWIEALKNVQMVVVIDPFLSDTADYCADYVIPCATYLERTDGLRGASTQYYKGDVLRQKVVDPLYGTMGEIELLMEIAKRGEFLTGSQGMIHYINKYEKIGSSYELDENTEPTVDEIFDAVAKSSYGEGYGLTYFKQHGLKVSEQTVDKKYMRYGDVTRFHLYSEILKNMGDTLSAKSIDAIYKVGYDSLPIWRTPYCENSPSEYNLYLITHKLVEHKQSRTPNIPFLMELTPENSLCINSVDARARGIEDEDEVWVENHNAYTNETKKLKVRAHVIEGIRPGVVSISAHYGHLAFNPWAKSKGVNVNILFPSGEGYIDNIAGSQSFCVKVKVWKGVG